MANIAARIALRYLHGDALINLNSIALVVADGGVVSSSDLQRVLGLHGIEAHDVVIYRLSHDPQNVFRWEGGGTNGTKVSGQVVVNLAHDSNHVVVQAEIALASRHKEASQEEDPATDPILPVKLRLQVISSIARRAIQDLRERPNEVAVVVGHLADITDLAEQDIDG